jgi:hypothetical protein
LSALKLSPTARSISINNRKKNMVERKAVQKKKQGTQPALHCRLPGPAGHHVFLLGKVGETNVWRQKNEEKFDKTNVKFYDYRS